MAKDLLNQVDVPDAGAGVAWPYFLKSKESTMGIACGSNASHAVLCWASMSTSKVLPDQVEHEEAHVAFAADTPVEPIRGRRLRVDEQWNGALAGRPLARSMPRWLHRKVQREAGQAAYPDDGIVADVETLE